MATGAHLRKMHSTIVQDWPEAELAKGERPFYCAVLHGVGKYS